MYLTDRPPEVYEWYRLACLSSAQSGGGPKAVQRWSRRSKGRSSRDARIGGPFLWHHTSFVGTVAVMGIEHSCQFPITNFATPGCSPHGPPPPPIRPSIYKYAIASKHLG